MAFFLNTPNAARSVRNERINPTANMIPAAAEIVPSLADRTKTSMYEYMSREA